jgi:hypothetical protein
MAKQYLDPENDSEGERRKAKEEEMDRERLEREEYIAENEKRILEQIKLWEKTGQDKKNKLLEEVSRIDKDLRTGLALVLNYYAEHGQFNQTLLEDVVPIIHVRHKLLRKMK